MHRHADTQVTLMYNTRTSIHLWVAPQALSRYDEHYTWSRANAEEIKAETHFFFSGEVLSLSIAVKIWNAAVVVSSWFDLVRSDLLCFAAHP